MDAVRLDDEIPRRLAVAAIIVAFSGYGVATTDPNDERYAVWGLALLVGIYGAVLAVVPRARSRLDPKWLLNFIAITVVFVVVLGIAARLVTSN